MFLSNRDIHWAIACGKLIVDPPPEQWQAGYDETSIDLHLDDVKEARIWDVARLEESQRLIGALGPEIHLGRFDYRRLSDEHLIPPPPESLDIEERKRQSVCLRGSQVIVKPGGFLLWTTREKVGTPVVNPELICFVEGKSTRARAGIIIHLTAPTIHSGWQGKITLEIANLGPFHFVLGEGDVIAQLTVATISSAPDLLLKKKPSATMGQLHVSGSSGHESPAT